MADTKMLQILIDGQIDMKKEMNLLRKEVQVLREDTKEGFTKVNSRLDVIGNSVAYLEDDTPTRKEFIKL